MDFCPKRHAINFQNPAGEACDDPSLGGMMLTNTTEIGTARLPARRVTIPAPTAVSQSAQRLPPPVPPPGCFVARRHCRERARHAGLRPDVGPLGLAPQAHQPDHRRRGPAAVPLLNHAQRLRLRYRDRHPPGNEITEEAPFPGSATRPHAPPRRFQPRPSFAPTWMSVPPPNLPGGPWAIAPWAGIGRTCTTRRSRGRGGSRPRRPRSRRRHDASWT